MKIKHAAAAALAIAALGLAPQAHAQWSDNFDSYTAGTAIAGQGGWTEWTGSIDVSGHVSNLFSNSMPNSLEIVGNPGGSNGQGDDTVHTFNATSGRWVFRVMTFVPTNATGIAWIILMNTYPPGTGNQWWSVQVELNGNANTVYSDHAPTTTLPLVRNAWVEFRVEVDLGADTASYFYNGAPLATNIGWRNLYAIGGAAAIAAVDLYGGEPTTGGTTGTYYDDASLMPVSTTTTINPTSTTLAPGIVISGLPADMFTSNDMYYVLRPGVVISSSQSPIVLTMSGTAPGNTPSDLKMVVESKSNQANIRETIESYNFGTNSYDQINQTVLTLSDVVKTLTIANPAMHVGPGNEVRTKISYKAVGPILSYPWRVSIDEATWRYTP